MRRCFSALLVVLMGATLFGCADDDLRGADDDAGPGPGSSSDDDSGAGNETGFEEDTSVPGDANCSEQAKAIYLVDTEETLYRFDPPAKSFVAIGALNCPVYASPVSMAVNRDAVAYVLYDGGKLFRVDTATGACEQQVANLWTGNRETRGMGFATVGSSSAEKLYSFVRAPSPSKLATIDTATWEVSNIGPMTGRPELTGTGAGELWGFFAAAADGPQVSKIDPGSGALLATYEAPVGPPHAWAFAFWGGEFYIFSRTYEESATTVYKMTADGQLSTYMTNTGTTIIGAGVSTCAPLAPI